MRITQRTALVIDLLLLLLVWYLVAIFWQKPFLPDPVTVLRTLWAELAVGWNDSQITLLEHSWRSLQRVVISVSLGTLVAMPLAILSAASPPLRKFLSPLIYFLYPAPKIVFLPIIIFILGLGDPSINFLIALVIFFQIYVIVNDAAAGVPAQTLDSIRSLGASRWDVIRHVYWPLSLPATVTALKVSMGTAIAVLFIAESIGNNVGLGYYIVVEQWNRFAYDKVYAGIITIGLIGTVLFGLLSLLERWSTRWRPM